MFRRLFRWFVRTIVIIAILIGLAALSDYVTHRVSPGSVLVVTLSGHVVERGWNGVSGLLVSNETPLNFVRRAISHGAKDLRIVGLAIKVIDPSMELAQAQELTADIKAFRKSGKWTAAYIETAGEGEPGNLPYLVAISTGDVSLMPEGELNLMGVAAREIFARGTLDWLGIRPNFAAIGKYKSAADIFTNKDFTPPQREEDEGLVGDLYDQVVTTIASERHLDLGVVK